MADRKSGRTRNSKGEATKEDSHLPPSLCSPHSTSPCRHRHSSSRLQTDCTLDSGDGRRCSALCGECGVLSHVDTLEREETDIGGNYYVTVDERYGKDGDKVTKEQLVASMRKSLSQLETHLSALKETVKQLREEPSIKCLL